MTVDAGNIACLAFVYSAPWGKLFRRACIAANRFPEGCSMAEDLIFFLSLCPNLKRCVFLHDALYHYRVNYSSGIAVGRVENSLILRREFVRLRDRWEQSPFPAGRGLLVLAAFIHAGIADAHRAAENPDIPLRTFITENKDFFDREFPDWKYIPLRPYGQFAVRCLAVWVCKYLYKMGLFRTFILLYNFIIKTAHLGLKW
jgi:hypothetical protein